MSVKAGQAPFLTVDPAVDQTRQPYAYTGNNPVSRTDPTGLDFVDDINTAAEGLMVAALAGIVFPNAWNVLRSDDPEAEVIGGWALGLSRPTTTYGEGSGLVNDLKTMNDTRSTQATIVYQLHQGTYAGPVDASYRAGQPGLFNPNFQRDFYTYINWGGSASTTEDRVKASLGTYDLIGSVVCIDADSRTAIVEFSGSNTTSLGSAIGIGQAGRDFWNSFAEVTGIGTAVTQTFYWQEQVSY